MRKREFHERRRRDCGEHSERQNGGREILSITVTRETGGRRILPVVGKVRRSVEEAEGFPVDQESRSWPVVGVWLDVGGGIYMGRLPRDNACRFLFNVHARIYVRVYHMRPCRSSCVTSGNCNSVPPRA